MNMRNSIVAGSLAAGVLIALTSAGADFSVALAVAFAVWTAMGAAWRRDTDRSATANCRPR